MIFFSSFSFFCFFFFVLLSRTFSPNHLPQRDPCQFGISSMGRRGDPPEMRPCGALLCAALLLRISKAPSDIPQRVSRTVPEGCKAHRSRLALRCLPLLCFQHAARQRCIHCASLKQRLRIHPPLSPRPFLFRSFSSPNTNKQPACPSPATGGREVRMEEKLRACCRGLSVHPAAFPSATRGGRKGQHTRAV